MQNNLKDSTLIAGGASRKKIYRFNKKNSNSTRFARKQL